MSEHLTPQNGPTGGGGNFAPGWRARQRRASVTLRQDTGEQDVGSLMDPATKSLSDALRITYRFVILAVICLGVFYIFSGARRVYEGERGIRLLFGRVVAEDVQPGFRLSVPEPFGELVKIRTGAQTIAIEDDFFPQLSEEEKKQFRDQGAQALVGGGYGKLNPETDGSVVTGDGGIAHTRWAITYHRDDPKRVAENIDPEFERSIVIAACKRGIVRAIASASIDELLKNSPDPTRTGDWMPVERRAHEIAQKTLDQMESGIQIDILSMTAKMPPRRVMTSFNQVQSSESESKQLIEEAKTDKKTTLVDAAGDAAEPILAQIKAYEKALELKNHEEASRILDRIDRLMEGEPVEIDGKRINPRVYGRVANILAEANSAKRTYIASLQGEVDRFNAKLESYRKNPMILLNSEWADAYSAVMARPYVQTMFLPELDSSGRFVLTFGTDKDIAKRIQQQYQKKKADEAEQERKRIAERARFEAKIESTMPVAKD